MIKTLFKMEKEYKDIIRGGDYVKNGFLSDLSEEEREIVEYGVLQGVVLIIGMVIAIIMGILLKILDKAILFLVCSYYLRIYAGGYHAKTQFRCSIFSAVATFLCFLWLKYVTLSQVILHALSLVAGVFVVIFAPIDNENRELEEIEKKVYSKKVKVVVLVESAIYVISVLLKWDSVYYCINLSMIFVATSMLMGMACRKMRRNCDENIIM